MKPAQISRAAASPAPRLRPLATTFAPSATFSFAVPYLMPSLPPITTGSCSQVHPPFTVSAAAFATR